MDTIAANHPNDELLGVIRSGYSGDIAPARAALRAADPALRRAALGALARAGALRPPDLTGDGVGMLLDSDPTVRRHAAWIASRPGVPPVDLTTSLADPDDRVREMAAFAAGEAPAGTPRVVELLISMAGDDADHLCREAAVAALGSIGDPRAHDAIVAACRDRATVRRRAVLALSQFPGDRSTTELHRLSQDRDIQVRQSAEDLLAIVEGHGRDAT